MKEDITRDSPPGGYSSPNEAKSAVLTLNSGTMIHLRHLKQWEVYDDSLEIVPTASVNDHVVERVVAREQRTTTRCVRWNWFREFLGRSSVDAPLLISPWQIPIESKGGYDLALLPAVACVGRFTSKLTRKDVPIENMSGDWALLERGYSELIVIWFQEDYAFPISPLIVKEIHAIDWPSRAKNKRILF